MAWRTVGLLGLALALVPFLSPSSPVSADGKAGDWLGKLSWNRDSSRVDASSQ
jgi:hypothetical protein